MPIYEYRCQSCGETFEVIQKFSDEPRTKCEHCGGALEKLLSPPGLHFKGTGWYVTDYARGSQGRSDGKGKSETADKAEKAKPDVSTKSESGAKKPAAPAGKSS